MRRSKAVQAECPETFNLRDAQGAVALVGIPEKVVAVALYTDVFCASFDVLGQRFGQRTSASVEAFARLLLLVRMVSLQQSAALSLEQVTQDEKVP